MIACFTGVWYLSIFVYLFVVGLLFAGVRLVLCASFSADTITFC